MIHSIGRVFKKSPVLFSGFHLENHISCNFIFSSPPEGSRILKTVKSLKDGFSKKDSNKPEFIPRHCDVLIIGGGVMGCSIAFWLKQRALEGLSVAVVEKDPTVMSNSIFDKLQYQYCTSMLSVGGLRQQFSLKENIELSLKSAEFFRNIKEHLSVEGQDPPDIQFHPSGYLFLAGDKGAEILEQNYKLQSSLGAKVELLSPDKLRERFPWLNTEGVLLGSHGLENEGWFDPYSLLFAFKRKAINLGAHFLPAELIEFGTGPLGHHDIIREGDSSVRYQFHSATLKLQDGNEHQINFSHVIIAAGALSGEVAKKLNIGKGDGLLALPLPVEPRKRYVFNVHCPGGPGVLAPLVVDPSGAYFRREGLTGHYLCGISPPDNEEPPTDNLDVDYSFFEGKVWPILANRVPAFESAKLKSAWAAFYDFNRFDENAFIGPHPAYSNVYLATGFSGHGIQQAPMVGKAMMELLIDNGYKTINLERLEFQRYLDNEPLWETNIV